jgi:hypothetical protein
VKENLGRISSEGGTIVVGDDETVAESYVRDAATIELLAGRDNVYPLMLRLWTGPDVRILRLTRKELGLLRQFWNTVLEPNLDRFEEEESNAQDRQTEAHPA